MADGIPSPKDVLGHHAGAPRELTYHAELLEYYRALAAASPRVSIMSTGRTDENREMVVVAIAAQDTIRDLERYRGHLSQLADPRDLSELEAAQVIAQAKPIYHFIAGLHSGETGPPEMLLELAYRLAVEEGPLFRPDPQDPDRHLDPGGRTGRPRPVCRLVLPAPRRHHRRPGPDRRTALLGKIRLSRQQPRHQLLAS